MEMELQMREEVETQEKFEVFLQGTLPPEKYLSHSN